MPLVAKKSREQELADALLAVLRKVGWGPPTSGMPPVNRLLSFAEMFVKSRDDGIRRDGSGPREEDIPF